MEEISVQEALSLARIREENAKFFYEAAVKIVELPCAKKFINELAEEEERHINMIAALQEKIIREGKVPESRESIQNMANVQNEPRGELGKDANFLDILRSAIAREQDAVKEYSNLHDSVEDGEAKELFKLLLNEEKKHLRRFEEDYDDFTDEMSHDKVRNLIFKMIR